MQEKKPVKKAKKDVTPVAESTNSPEGDQENVADEGSDGSTIDDGSKKKKKKMVVDPNSTSKCKDPYKNKHLDLINRRREELISQGVEPEKNLTIESLKEYIETKKMSVSNVAEVFGCPDVYVSSLMKANGIVPNMIKETQMIVARNRGAM